VGDFFWEIPITGLRYSETDTHPDFIDTTTAFGISSY